jgi:hypothetical protein
MYHCTAPPHGPQPAAYCNCRPVAVRPLVVDGVAYHCPLTVYVLCTFRAPTSELSKENAVQLCFVRTHGCQQSLNDAVPLNAESTLVCESGASGSLQEIKIGDTK